MLEIKAHEHELVNMTRVLVFTLMVLDAWPVFRAALDSELT